jgi:hypothetical protein
MSDSREYPQVNVRTVLTVAAAVFSFLIVVVVILAFAEPGLINTRPQAMASFPGPSVTQNERAERILLERTQRERLAGKNGTMPIEQAMAAIAAKGAAAYGPVTGVAQ